MDNESRISHTSGAEPFSPDALNDYYDTLDDELEQLAEGEIGQAGETLAVRQGYEEGLIILAQFAPGQEFQRTGNRPARDGSEQRYRFAAKIDTFRGRDSSFEYNIVHREVSESWKLGSMSQDERQRLLVIIDELYEPGSVDEELVEAMNAPSGFLREFEDVPCYTETVYDYVCEEETLSIRRWVSMAMYIGRYRVYDMTPGMSIEEGKAYREVRGILEQKGETHENITGFQNWGIEMSHLGLDDIERIEEVLCGTDLADQDLMDAVALRRESRDED